MATRTILLNPRPALFVRVALGRGDWCHREPEFARLMQDINARLAAVYPSLRGGFSMAGVFFVLLYRFPAAMLLYCTENNLWHLVRLGWSRRRRPGAVQLLS